MTFTACQKGASAELLFCAVAGAKGYEIIIPWGHSSTVDVWMRKPPYRPMSVQVKTATLIASGYHISVKRATAGGRPRPYEKGDFDVLAAWLPDIEQFVLWTFDDIKGRITICYNPARHRQPDNWELLDDVAESLTLSGSRTADV